jgi:type II secretory pathway pseudopilin PulG
MRRRPGRPGFSLLEMVLAVSIAMILLTAMYWLYSTQLQSAQTGREKLAEITLARSILTRMASDIVTQLGPYDPRVLPESAASSGASSTTDTTGTTGTTGTNTPAAGDTSGMDSTSSNSTMSAGPTSSVTGINLGVYGETTRLVLTVSRIPRAAPLKPATTGAAAADVAPVVPSDLRRITYWLVGSAGDAQGLARQELTRVTSDDASTFPPNGVDPTALVIAPEVANLTFEFFDGTNWVQSWDGTAPGPDGDTPLGPPAAIAITIELRRPGQTADDPDARPRYRHVVALPTANTPGDQTAP